MSIELESLRRKVESLESKLMDAHVDLNMKDARISELEKQLREAQFKIRELEMGTQTMRTLALQEEEDSFDPRESGVFHKDTWRGAR